MNRLPFAKPKKRVKKPFKRNVKVSKNPLKPTRKMKISTAKDRAWKAFSIFIRTRDCLDTTGTTTHGICYTCGVRKESSLLDAGHLVAGRHNKYLLDETQVKIQCKYCNNNLQGYGAKFYDKLCKELGKEVVDQILIDNKENIKYTVGDFLELERVFNGKTQNLLKSTENNRLRF